MLRPSEEVASLTPQAQDRTRRPIERRQRPVAGGLDQPATEALDVGAKQLGRSAPRECPSRRRHPGRQLCSVDPTMSVNRTVASTRSCRRVCRLPVTNCSISSNKGSISPENHSLLLPGSVTSSLAPGILSARKRAWPGRTCRSPLPVDYKHRTRIVGRTPGEVSAHEQLVERGRSARPRTQTLTACIPTPERRPRPTAARESPQLPAAPGSPGTDRHTARHCRVGCRTASQEFAGSTRNR